MPLTRILIEQRLSVHAVDASPTLADAFAARFPHAPIECAPAEQAESLTRQHDAIIAWGLLFLFEPAAQKHLISLAAALDPAGR